MVSNWFARIGWRDTRGGQIESAPEWFTQLTTAMRGNAPQLRYANILNTLVDWLQALYPTKGVVSFYLDGLDNALTLIPKDQLTATIKSRYAKAKRLFGDITHRLCGVGLLLLLRPPFTEPGTKSIAPLLDALDG